MVLSESFQVATIIEKYYHLENTSRTTLNISERRWVLKILSWGWG